MFSFATALYVLAGAFTLAVTLWALGTSLVGRDLGIGHRILGFVTAALLPAAAVTYTMGAHLGISHSGWALAAMPILSVSAALCNAVTLSRQRIGWKALHFPVLVYNALLAGVYFLRALQELAGLDLGTPAAALTHAHAVVQTFVGHPSALEDPIWLHLPLVLPLAWDFHLGHKVATLACSLFASGVMALYVMVMPYAFERVTGYRAQPGDLPAAHAVRDIGIVVPWADRVMRIEARESLRASVLELGVHHVAMCARPGLFTDEALLLQVQEEIQWARDQGLKVVTCAMPPKERLLRPAIDVAELARDMAQLHWLLAEKLAPDLLVLYSEPFDEMLSYLAGGSTLQQWMQAIRRSAADVARANSGVKVAVTLGSRAPHAEELFRMLVAGDSPVHSVGLAFAPGPHDAEDLSASLASATRWCQRIPGERPVRILSARAGVYQCGGELGQWHFLLRVLAGLEGTGRVQSATVDGLMDQYGAHGLITENGRRRLAFRELRDRLTAGAPGAPR